MHDTSRTLRKALGVLFVGASVIQGTNREFFSALVPKQFAGNKDQLQGAMTAGLAGLGLSFLLPIRPVARWLTTAVLVGTLTAAADQVRNPPEALTKAGIPPALVIARIPIQALVVALAWVATRKPDRD